MMAIVRKKDNTVVHPFTRILSEKCIGRQFCRWQKSQSALTQAHAGGLPTHQGYKLVRPVITLTTVGNRSAVKYLYDI